MRPSVLVAVGLAAVCVLALGDAVMMKYGARFSLSHTRDAASWYPYPDSLKASSPGCTVTVSHRSLGAVDIESWLPQNCAIPATAGRLAVAGDSHALAYGRLLRRFAFESGREVDVYSLPGCAFIGFFAPDEPGCAGFEHIVADDLAKRLGPQDVLFLPSLRMPRYTEQWAGGDPPATTARLAPMLQQEMALREARDILQQLTIHGTHIVFEMPPPVLKAPPFRCSDWFNAANAVCAGGLTVGRAEIEMRRAPAVDAMQGLSKGSRQISLWDPLPILCPGPVCSAFDNGLPLFFDGDHLSGHGDDILYPSFRSAINSLWTQPEPAGGGSRQ